MTCPHCRIGVTDVVASFETDSARFGKVVHESAEVCDQCGWWCAPPRQADDPLLMARTSGYGYTTQVP